MVIVGTDKNEWVTRTHFEFVSPFSVRKPESGGLVCLLGGLSRES